MFATFFCFFALVAYSFKEKEKKPRKFWLAWLLLLFSRIFLYFRYSVYSFVGMLVKSPRVVESIARKNYLFIGQSAVNTATPFRMPLGICDILLKNFFLSSHNHRLISFLHPPEHPYIQIRIPYFDISVNNLAFPSLEPFPVLLHYNSHNSNQNIFSSRSKRRSVPRTPHPKTVRCQTKVHAKISVYGFAIKNLCCEERWNWKHIPLTTSLKLIKNAWNYLWQSTLGNISTFCNW